MGGDDGVYAGGDGGEYGLWRLSKKEEEEVFCGCWNIHRCLLHRVYLQFGDFSCKNLQLSP